MSEARPKRERKLRFCPESNDLLYPREDREAKKLIYFCKNCGYEENVPESDYCVYLNEIRHTAKEKTIILKDVRNDPTFPRTQDVRCPLCNHNEAAFASSDTVGGMALVLHCTACGHRWKDEA
ncbi:hypothetical protein BSKO_06400 [Bryopsis sp. KO-2023]|nr:hypothetical protein BSKO_06400 [Bryopsis sp. KO-2023]